MNTPLSCLDIVQSYIEYVSKGFHVSLYGDKGCHIMTPFIRPDGDHIEIYILADADGHLVISDEGETSDWLFSIGLDLDAKRRSELVSDLAKTYGLTYRKGEFSVISKLDAIGESVHDFITGLQAINQLVLLQREHGGLTFKDNVAFYLEETGQEYQSNARIQGKTIEHQIDFYLNSSRNWIVEALSASNVGRATSTLKTTCFKFSDIALATDEYRRVALIDDSEGQWEDIWGNRKIQSLLGEYTDRVVRWSERTQLLRLPT